MMCMKTKNEGFSLVELIVAIGMFFLLAGVLAISTTPKGKKQNQDLIIQNVIAELRHQQLRSMGVASELGVFGVQFGTNGYDFFSGNEYIPESIEYTTKLEQGYHIQTTLPDNQVLFSRLSGEVMNWSDQGNTISIISEDESTTILTINKLGVVSSQ